MKRSGLNGRLFAAITFRLDHERLILGVLVNELGDVPTGRPNVASFIGDFVEHMFDQTGSEAFAAVRRVCHRVGEHDGSVGEHVVVSERCDHVVDVEFEAVRGPEELKRR